MAPSLASCPHCGGDRITYLAGVSAPAIVDYFRCERCGNVYVQSKDGCGGPPRVISKPVIKRSVPKAS